MMKRSMFVAVILLLGLVIPLQGRAQTDLNGQWYGAWWDVDDHFWSGAADTYLTESEGSGTAIVYVPSFDLFHEEFPLTVVGDQITIGDPAVLGFTGTIIGETIEGQCWQASTLIATWHVEKDTGAPTFPGPAPGPICDDLPPMFCHEDSVGYCSELIPFEPAEGPGYINYPMPGGETWEDQIFSYLRRDFVHLVKYATAKVACKTAEWDYGNFAPLGLGDMSEEDGSTPGASLGQLRHPVGTHEDGKDIDTAYYQLYSPDNLLRPVGDHYEGTVDQYHLVGEPYALDSWRTALYIAYLSEHPNLRVVGVDGRIGPILETTLNDLVTLGWITQELRESIPLAYEVVDEGLGWYYFHHHHMHISFLPTEPEAVEEILAAGATQLIGCFPNPFKPSTTVAFTLTESRPVKLSIHDIAGRLVGRIFEGESLPAGVHEVTWDGRDFGGRRLSPGVYFLKLKAGTTLETQKVVLLD